MKQSSLLELLHPDGRASTSLVIGSNCPPILFPEVQQDSSKDNALVILAPSLKECRTNGWLVEAAELMACRLAPDGVGYLLVPRRYRFKMSTLLHNLGLFVGFPVVHLPDWELSHYLVPFAPAPVQYAFTAFISIPAWKQHLIIHWLHFQRAARFLGYIWPAVGLVVRHPNARPLFEWLFKQGNGLGCEGSALIRTNWRSNGATLLFSFAKGDEQPSSVAKLTTVTRLAENPVCEAEALTRLGVSAHQAGAQVPRLLPPEKNSISSPLIQTVVSGRPVSMLLRSQPDRFASIVTEIVSWLERWNCSTAMSQPLTVDRLNHDLLMPAAFLAPLLEQGDTYLKWLVSRAQAAIGMDMPFVDTHNDLTMFNILIDEHHHLGIVDWETGQRQGWPLVDFYYSLHDAVFRASNYTDRFEAFKACFTAEGKMAAAAAGWHAQLMSTLNLSKELAELCFHACWIHHAANELRITQPGVRKPFLNIIQWLALHYPVFDG